MYYIELINPGCGCHKYFKAKTMEELHEITETYKDTHEVVKIEEIDD
jgi:hypothetical protein